MELNRNLAHRKILSSLTFLSILSFGIGHVTCHVIIFLQIANIWRIGDGFKRKHQKNKNALMMQIKYLQPFTFGMSVHLKKL